MIRYDTNCISVILQTVVFKSSTLTENIFIHLEMINCIDHLEFVYQKSLRYQRIYIHDLILNYIKNTRILSTRDTESYYWTRTFYLLNGLTLDNSNNIICLNHGTGNDCFQKY